MKQLKQKSATAGILILLTFLLRFPAEALSAAREGLSLWLNTLLPTLLPFLILTGILLHTDGIEKALKPFARLWKLFLGLTPNGAYAFFLGVLCGCPMGAKTAADLYSRQKISRREAEYLLTFSCTPSPAFLLNYLAVTCLGGKTPSWRILGVLLTSSIACMIFFRFVVYKNQTTESFEKKSSKKETSPSSQGAIVDVSIMNGFETITRLGGYILLFSLVSALIGHYWPFSNLSGCLLLAATEITTGIYQLSILKLPYELLYLASMCAASFGGLCILAQTKSVLNGQLSVLPYLASRFLCALCTALLIILFRFVI